MVQDYEHRDLYGRGVIVQGYIDKDLYGRGSDIIFGKGAAEQTKRQALLKLKAIRDAKVGILPDEHVEWDLYGRGDPRIFGKDAHIANYREAAAELARRQALTAPWTGLHVRPIPVRKLMEWSKSAASSVESYSDQVTEVKTIEFIGVRDAVPEQGQTEMLPVAGSTAEVEEAVVKRAIAIEKDVDGSPRAFLRAEERTVESDHLQQVALKEEANRTEPEPGHVVHVSSARRLFGHQSIPLPSSRNSSEPSLEKGASTTSKFCAIRAEEGVPATAESRTASPPVEKRKSSRSSSPEASILDSWGSGFHVAQSEELPFNDRESAVAADRDMAISIAGRKEFGTRNNVASHSLRAPKSISALSKLLGTPQKSDDSATSSEESGRFKSYASTQHRSSMHSLFQDADTESEVDSSGTSEADGSGREYSHSSTGSEEDDSSATCSISSSASNDSSTSEASDANANRIVSVADGERDSNIVDNADAADVDSSFVESTIRKEGSVAAPWFAEKKDAESQIESNQEDNVSLQTRSVRTMQTNATSNLEENETEGSAAFGFETNFPAANESDSLGLFDTTMYASEEAVEIAKDYRKESSKHSPAIKPAADTTKEANAATQPALQETHAASVGAMSRKKSTGPLNALYRNVKSWHAAAFSMRPSGNAEERAPLSPSASANAPATFADA